MKFTSIYPKIRKYFMLMIVFIGLGVLFFLLAIKFDSNDIAKNVFNSLGGTLITIGLITLWIELNNSIQIVSMIRLFGDHKSEGIERIFTERTKGEFQQKREELLISCKTYKSNTLVGRKYINENSNVQRTLELANKCETFQLLFMDSDSEGYAFRYKYLEPIDSPDVIGIDRKEAIRKAQDNLACQINGKNKNKHIGRYTSLSPYNLEFIDDYLFVSFYGVKARALNSPIILLRKTTESKIFNYFDFQFSVLLKESFETKD